MMDGTYAIEVDTPLGRKSGTVGLATSGNTVTFELDAPIIGKKRAKGALDGNAFSLDGTIKAKLIGTIHCAITGEVTDDILNATIHTPKGDFAVVGVRVA